MITKTVTMETPLGDVTISGNMQVVDEVVARCNVYSRLLGACKAAKSFIDGEVKPYPPPGGYTLSQMKQVLNEAIAAAEPEPS